VPAGSTFVTSAASPEIGGAAEIVPVFGLCRAPSCSSCERPPPAAYPSDAKRPPRRP